MFYCCLLRNRRILENLHDLESERHDKLHENISIATQQAEVIQMKYEEVYMNTCMQSEKHDNRIRTVFCALFVCVTYII